MSQKRMINTHFWDDNYVTELDPIEKLIFLYLLTNPLTNIAGVYELKLRKIAFDTGIDKDMIARIFARFEKDDKIIYKSEYVFLINFIKNQSLNPSVKQGIDRVINNLPNDIKNMVLDRLGTDWGQTDIPNLTKPNLTKPNLTPKDGVSKKEDQEQYDLTFEKFWKLYPRKDGNKTEAFRLLLNEKIQDYGKFFQAVRNYAADCENRDIKYIKYPVSFIPIWKDFL